MPRLLFVIVFIVGSIVATVSAAQTRDRLFEPFDPGDYAKDELRLLQLGLALEGQYKGLLDGDWGPRSQQSLETYVRDEFESNPANAHIAYLAYSTMDVLVEDEWVYQYFETLGLSFLMPSANLNEGGESDDFVNFEHGGSSLKYSISVGDADWTQKLHDYAGSFHDSSEPLYTIRKDGSAITAAVNTSGEILYVRSRFWDGGWSTLLLSAERQDAGFLGAVSSSITTDPYIDLKIPETGFLFEQVSAAHALWNDSGVVSEPELGSSVQPGPSLAEAEDVDSETGSGSGFWVSDRGHVLTNAHVVKGCGSLRVNGKPATLVNASANFDLALIATEPNQHVASFARVPAKLNQDVTVVGYPLAFILGGVNVTRGAISGMTGLAGDETTMQISAPVQVGNSGGPVISQAGDVVGVVVSKLDATAVQGAIGDVPQNINFAVRGEVAKLFLSLNGIEPRLGQSDEAMSPVDLAQRATGYTAFIECN